MALFGAILLILLGMVALFVAGAMLSVREATTQFLNGFPKMMRDMMMESDPKVAKTMRTIERLPLISAIVAGSGGLVFILGLVLLHNLIAAVVVFILVATLGVLFWLYRGRLTEMLKQQFTDQMKKQVANAPRPTPAQARDQFRAVQERARAQAAAVPPTNRSQRRAAQRRGGTPPPADAATSNAASDSTPSSRVNPASSTPKKKS